uniref:SANT domain-containing protein n=1 Tax=Trichobilharzia regenti TaxID=157069 RepID=A0AA85JE74_TRIRE|nr:unnamed protein product [Trichobilharzia regenti]
MGEFCSKPESGNSQSHPNAPSGGTQNNRSRDGNAVNASTASAGFLSNMCDTISRLQSESHLPPNSLPPGSRIAVSPEQAYVSNITRNGRPEVLSGAGPPHTSGSHAGMLTAEDMLTAAQICSHLSQSQLSALAAAYHHQQQQIQRSVNPMAAGNPSLGHVPGMTFAQALAAVPSISKSSSPTVSLGVHNTHQPPRQPFHPSQAVMHQNSQKRPPSGQSQFHPSHSAQIGSTASSTRPSLASQSILHHRGNHTGLPGFGAVSSHGSISQPITSHIEPGSNSHNTHHQTRASPSLSPSPGNNIYQNRRSQLAPSNHPNKRPRISVGSQPPHPVSSLPSGHVTNTISPAGMEALLGSVVVSKAMASLAAGSNFLNPNAYSAATEVAAAAAAALTPFYTSINNGNVSNSASVTTPNQAVYQPHNQQHGSMGNNSSSGAHFLNQQHILPSSSTAYPGSLMGPIPGSLLNSLNNRPFSHTTVSAQVITSGQSLVSAPGLGCQSVASHPQSSHLPTKAPHPTSVAQNPSRLISGHLHHPHVPTHPTQGNFHQSNHPLPQPNSQHMMGHSNLPQGSGVLRQQTKEPAYHPQVEAISPAPDESRLVDAQDAKLHREREEVNRQLTVLDADINKQESHLRNLCEREARLAARLAAAPAPDISNKDLEGSSDPDIKAERSDTATSEASFTAKKNFQRNYENPIQAIISENRQRTRQRHLIFTKLCGPKVNPGPYALPFYRQPSDLPSVRAIQSRFRGHFRSKLILYLQRRLRAEQSRIKFLAQQYERNSKIFTKKMDKLLSTTKRRQRDLRHRDIFEKALPEVKKNREDREMGSTEYAKSGGEDADSGGMSNLADGSQATPYDAIEEMNKLKEYAIDPPVMLAPWQRRYQFICESGLVTDCRAQLQETQDLSRWSEEEKQIFKERFLATPKNFTSIAAHLDRKTVADCIHYYYLTKKKEGYKQLLKKHNARRRRAAQTERGGGGSGGASSNSNTGGSSGGHGNNGSHSNAHSAPPSGNCQNVNTNSPRGDNNEPEEKDAVNPKTSQADSSGPPESNENAEIRDADGSKSSSKRDGGGSSGARSRTGRGRPSQHSSHSNHSNADNNSTASHGRNRENKCSRNNTDSQTRRAFIDAKESETDHSLPTLDKELPVEDKKKNDSDSHTTTTSSNSQMAEAVTNSNKSQANSEAVSSTSPCIKDLIHFAIEKNLSKPSNDNQTNSTETSSRFAPSEENMFQTANSNSENCDVSTSKTMSSSTLPMTSISCDSSNLNKDNLDSSPTIFPSTTAAEIYAAAARFAAVSANACGMNTDPSAISVSESVENGNRNVSHSSSSSISSSTTFTQSKSDQCDISSLDVKKKWVASTSLPCSTLGYSHQNSAGRSLDPSASSKAILIGDFLTAQQLGRTDSSSWGNSHVTSRSADYTGSSHQLSRSIDPSTLPVCHPSHSSTAYNNYEPQSGSNYRSVSVVSDKGLSNDFLAEHAIRLAMQAKAAAAAAAAASASASIQLDGGRPSASIIENNFNSERCVYSPLTPSPVKGDGVSATVSLSSSVQPILSRIQNLKNDGMHHFSPSFPNQSVGISNSMHSKLDSDPSMSINAAQVASFVANANRLYLEEVGSYTSRDRSDSMRTLTSSEATQLYSVLQHLRQQKQDGDSLSHQKTCHVSNTNIDISKQNFREQQTEDMGIFPPRPHSSENTSDHPVDPYSEREIMRGAQSRFMGYNSPLNMPEDSHGTRKSVSRTGHSNFIPDSVDPSCDPSALASEARYRRRGYTESQINLRHISNSTGPNICSSVGDSQLVPVHSELPNKLPAVEEKGGVSPTSFTTATYIDALINSHLSKSSKTQVDRPRTSSNSNESDVNQPALVSITTASPSSFSKYSLPELTVEESKTFTYRTDNSHAVHGHQSITGKRSSIPIGSNTLENPINKAIAEEIRAKTSARNSAIPSNVCSPHQSRTPSPVSKFHSTRNSESQFCNMNVPPKKQDRSLSRSLECNQNVMNKTCQKLTPVDEKRKAPELGNNVTIDSPMNHSASPVSDIESPGKLQIDLATSSYSPKVVHESANSVISGNSDCRRNNSPDHWSYAYPNDIGKDCDHNSSKILEACNIDSSDSTSMKTL